MKKGKARLALGIFLGLFFCGCAAPEPSEALFPAPENPDVLEKENPTVILLTHSESPESETERLAERFQEVLEEASDQFRVFIYPDNTLGSLDSGVDYLSRGAVEMRIGSGPSKVMQIARWLPLLTDMSLEKADQGLGKDGTLRALMEAESREKGIQVLTVFPAEYRVLTSMEKVDSPKQMDDCCIRVMKRGFDGDLWELLGAESKIFSIEEVSLALQLGYVNSQENTLSSIISNRIYEEQQYVIETKHKIYFDTLMVNCDFFDALPAADRALIIDCAEQVAAEERENRDRKTEEQLAFLQEQGLELIAWSEEKREQMKEIIYPELWRDLCENYGETQVNTVIAAYEQEK